MLHQKDFWGKRYNFLAPKKSAIRPCPEQINPNVADLYRGKTRQSAPDVAAHSLCQVEAYFTVRDVLAEASTVADGVL